ncbi:MAG: PD40 domain-containing protein [Chthonomonadetes bacterium]|nr:PD40 domain-containing protein [Chthonomonadetes bacterium]
MLRSSLGILAMVVVFLSLLLLLPLASRFGITFYLWRSSHYLKGWTSLPYTYDVSPTGDTIVFTGDGAGGRDLYLLETSSRQIRRLTQSDGFEHEVRFLSEHMVVVSIAEVPEHPLTSKHLYLVDIRNGAIRKLTDENRTYDGDPIPLSSHEILFQRTKIEYTMKPWGLEVDGSDPHWYVLDIRNGASQQVATQDFYLEDGFVNAIFQDRQRILETSIIGNRHDLFLRYLSVPIGNLPIRSKRSLRLARNGRDAALSPDEQSICYVSDNPTKGQCSLLRMDLKSRQTTQLLSRDQFLTSLRLRGQWLFFVEGKGDQVSLWRLHTQSKKLEQLLSPAQFANPPREKRS